MPVITERGLEYVQSKEFVDELSLAAMDLKLDINELVTLFYLTAIRMCELPEGAATDEELHDFIAMNFPQIHKITTDALDVASRPWKSLMEKSEDARLLH